MIKQGKPFLGKTPSNSERLGRLREMLLAGEELAADRLAWQWIQQGVFDLSNFVSYMDIRGEAKPYLPVEFDGPQVPNVE